MRLNASSNGPHAHRGAREHDSLVVVVDRDGHGAAGGKDRLELEGLAVDLPRVGEADLGPRVWGLGWGWLWGGLREVSEARREVVLPAAAAGSSSRR